MQRNPRFAPGGLSGGAPAPAFCRRGEGRILIDPGAVMIAIDPGGGEIAKPFELFAVSQRPAKCAQ